MLHGPKREEIEDPLIKKTVLTKVIGNLYELIGTPKVKFSPEPTRKYKIEHINFLFRYLSKENVEYLIKQSNIYL